MMVEFIFPPISVSLRFKLIHFQWGHKSSQIGLKYLHYFLLWKCTVFRHNKSLALGVAGPVRLKYLSDVSLRKHILWSQKINIYVNLLRWNDKCRLDCDEVWSKQEINSKIVLINVSLLFVWGIVRLILSFFSSNSVVVTHRHQNLCACVCLASKSTKVPPKANQKIIIHFTPTNWWTQTYQLYKWLHNIKTDWLNTRQFEFCLVIYPFCRSFSRRFQVTAGIHSPILWEMSCAFICMKSKCEFGRGSRTVSEGT